MFKHCPFYNVHILLDIRRLKRAISRKKFVLCVKEDQNFSKVDVRITHLSVGIGKYL